MIRAALLIAIIYRIAIFDLLDIICLSFIRTIDISIISIELYKNSDLKIKILQNFSFRDLTSNS